ncbi:MAG: histidine phosphatase family protein [Acidimicrobiia bacterium]
MELVLIRHAEPAWVVDGRTSNDPDLTARGVEQAKAVATHPALEDATALWVSPYLRSRRTAEPVAERLGLDPIVEPFLAEVTNPPSWHGGTPEEVSEAIATFQARHPDEWWAGFDGGETVRDFHDRVTSGFEKALTSLGATRSADHPVLWDHELADHRIVIVAHQGTNAMLITFLLGLDVVAWEWERFYSAHASVAVVETSRIGLRKAFSLRAFSDTRHLPTTMVTR